TAFANGCVLRCSTAEASASTSSHRSQEIPVSQSAERFTITVGCPRVSVPVLSNATAFTPPSASRYAPPLISTPRRAAAVIALIIGTGVLITSEHGQAITSSSSARYSQPCVVAVL